MHIIFLSTQKPDISFLYPLTFIFMYLFSTAHTAFVISGCFYVKVTGQINPGAELNREQRFLLTGSFPPPAGYMCLYIYKERIIGQY